MFLHLFQFLQPLLLLNFSGFLGGFLLSIEAYFDKRNKKIRATLIPIIVVLFVLFMFNLVFLVSTFS